MIRNAAEKTKENLKIKRNPKDQVIYRMFSLPQNWGIEQSTRTSFQPCVDRTFATST